MSFFEETINEKPIFEGKIVKLVVQDVKLQNGKEAKREIVKHPGGVAVLAFLDEDTVLFVEQFRKPFDKMMLELPAGKLEYGEDPAECGKRELEEETGYKAGKFTFLGKVVSSPGFCTEAIHLYKAEDLYAGNIGGDEDEFINIHRFKMKEVRDMIASGEIVDAKTISAVMYHINTLIP